MLCWVCAPLHALLAGVIDAGFSAPASGIDLPSMAEARAPVDLLLYTALAAALFAQTQWSLAMREATRADGLLQRLNASAIAPPASPTLLVALGRRKVVVPLREIDRIAAAGNYATVVWRGREGMIRTTLDALAEALDSEGFARAHRGTIVNLASVQEVHKADDGRAELILANGDAVSVGRRFRGEVFRRLDRRRPPPTAP